MKRTLTQHPGPAIRAARRAIEMSQLKLAVAIGRSPAYVCNFEKARIPATPADIEAMRSVIARAKAGT